MKKPLFVTMFALGVLVFAGLGVARAQEETVFAHVSFAFVANGKLMPAGDYRVLPDPSLENVLQIVSEDGRYMTFSIFENVDLGAKQPPTSFEFKKIGNEYVLWRISMPGRPVAELPLTLGRPSETRLAAAATEKGHKGN